MSTERTITDFPKVGANYKFYVEEGGKAVDYTGKFLGFSIVGTLTFLHFEQTEGKGKNATTKVTPVNGEYITWCEPIE
jgi:hypothetical protein